MVGSCSCATHLALAIWILAGSLEASAGDCLTSGKIIPAEKRTNVVSNGKSTKLRLSVGSWASAQILSHIGRILLEEKLGYNVEFLPKRSSSFKNYMQVAGCNDTNKKHCHTGSTSDAAHIAFEVWQGYISGLPEMVAQQAPKNIPFCTLITTGAEGFFLKSSILATASKDDVYLDWYKSYNSLGKLNAHKYFDSHSDLPAPEQSCGLAGVYMTDYIAATGDTEAAVEVNGKKKNKCDAKGWALSPACRKLLASGAKGCIPVISPNGWGVSILAQLASHYDMPLALGSFDYSSYAKVSKAHKVLYYWWNPDGTFTSLKPLILTFPAYNPDEHAKKIYKTAIADARILKCSSPAIADLVLVQQFLEAVGISGQGLQAMVASADGVADSKLGDMACDWLKSNMWAVDKWVPKATSCVLRQGLVDTNGNFLKTMKDATGCEFCSLGRFSSALQTSTSRTYTCEACAAGRFQSSLGSSSCLPCEAGRYASKSARAECSLCTIGHYQDKQGQSSCEACPATFTTKHLGAKNRANDCKCGSGYYRDSENRAKCNPCLKGMSCAFGADAIRFDKESMPPLLQANYYTELARPTFVYLCLEEGICAGGLPGTCKGGRLGFLCAECPEGKHTDGTGCKDCNTGKLFIFFGSSIAAVCVAVGMLYAAMLRSLSQSSHTITMFLLGGQLVTFGQVLGSFSSADLHWGTPFKDFIKSFSLAAMDLNALSIQCVGMTDPAGMYVLKMCLPLICAFIMVVSYFAAKAMKPVLVNFEGFVNAIGQVLVIFFITLGLATLLPFQCFSHPNGESALVQFPQIMCGGSEPAHQAMVIVAVFAILVYLGGTLSMVFYATFRYPYEIIKGDIKFVHKYRFLFVRWTPERYWFCTVLILRNFCIALFPMVISRDNVDMCALLLHWTLAGYLLLVCTFMPWRSNILNAVDVITGVCLEIMITVGSLSVYGQEVSGAISMLLTVILIFSFLVFVCLLGHRFVASKISQKRFELFLSHHKGGGACTARFLKIALQSVVRGTIFYDVDNLATFGGIFDAVKESKRVLLILSGDALCRPWVVGEIVTAHYCRIPVITCTIGHTDERPKIPTDRWQTLSKEEFVDLFGEFEKLRPYGIAVDDITPAIVALLETTPIHLNIVDAPAIEKSLKPVIPTSIIGFAKSAFDRNMSESNTAEILTMTDPDDFEATSSALVLKWMVQQKMQIQVSIDVGVSPTDLEKLLQSPKLKHILWIVTSSTLTSPAQLARLALLDGIRSAKTAMPVLIGESYSFPTDEFYLKLTSDRSPFGTRLEATKVLSEYGGSPIAPEDVVASLKSVFQSIAIFVNVPYATETMLKISVVALTDRIGKSPQDVQIRSAAEQEKRIRCGAGAEDPFTWI